MSGYDALLIVSFGGPEGPDEVMPFLERVTRGRNVPRERLEVVAEHYHHFGGVSPINARTRNVIEALRAELSANDIALPVYWGNRNWRPLLTDTVRQMRDDGVRRALAIATSALSSYSSCRVYLEDIAKARHEVGEGAPEIDKIRPFYNHPGYVETCSARLVDALARLPAERRAGARVLYSAHSIPVSMADGCAYVAQLEELAELVSAEVRVGRWEQVYQSRSGPPQVPWLEPDVLDVLDRIAEEEPGAAVVVAPFGFVADHMEVVYDLDVEAEARAAERGLTFVRASAANAHPRFVRMLRELIEERLGTSERRAALGRRGALPDRCAPDCCAPPRRPRRPAE